MIRRTIFQNLLDHLLKKRKEVKYKELKKQEIGRSLPLTPRIYHEITFQERWFLVEYHRHP